MTIIQDVSEFSGEFFGNWLQRTRKRRGISSADLARRIGVSRSYISALERGQVQLLTGRPSQPALEKVENIANALAVDVDEARMMAGYDPAPEAIPFDSDGLYRGLEKLTPEKRRLAEKQIKAIIDSLADADHDFDYIDD